MSSRTMAAECSTRNTVTPYISALRTLLNLLGRHGTGGIRHDLRRTGLQRQAPFRNRYERLGSLPSDARCVGPPAAGVRRADLWAIGGRVGRTPAGRDSRDHRLEWSGVLLRFREGARALRTERLPVLVATGRVPCVQPNTAHLRGERAAPCVPRWWRRQQRGSGARMHGWETRMLLKHSLERGVSEAECVETLRRAPPDDPRVDRDRSVGPGPVDRWLAGLAAAGSLQGDHRFTSHGRGGEWLGGAVVVTLARQQRQHRPTMLHGRGDAASAARRG